MINFVDQSKFRSGNVLIMSLLLLASGLAGGLAVAVLVISEIRQSSAIDSGLVAYFSAESGLEESIYDIRQKDICSNLCATPGPGCLCQQSDYQDCILPISNNTSLCSTTNPTGCVLLVCNKQIQPTKVLPVGALGENDTFQIDVDPVIDNLTGFRFFWSKSDGAVGTDEPLLEVSYVVINTTNNSTEVVRPNLNQPYMCNDADGDNACSSVTNNNTELPFSQSNMQVYQLRLKALRNNITELIVWVLPENSAQLANYLDVRSKGEHSNIQQILRTQIPRNLPVVGLPDYVIFSEETIVK